ncbi:MAG: ribonuclease HII [Candidatus Bathyarchaeota archaeon]|nr:MAG: ribonuclease HII [Candidatus Bathyarchaeota archaeon]
MQILGIDEAGRGCVLGPLVIAGVLIDNESQSKLLDLGVKDSKLLSPNLRKQFARKIRHIAISTHIIKLSPAEIDNVVNRGRRLHRLNRLEAQTMAKIIEASHPDIAIVDASDVLPQRYKQHIMECLSFKLEVISEHKADRNYPLVSAASIIAIVERDHDIDKLKLKHGDFGSGYMTDPKTTTFLKELAKKYGTYPDFVRRSWKPAKTAKINARSKQAKLHESLAKA